MLFLLKLEAIIIPCLHADLMFPDDRLVNDMLLLWSGWFLFFCACHSAEVQNFCDIAVTIFF